MARGSDLYKIMSPEEKRAERKTDRISEGSTLFARFRGGE